MLEMSAPIKNDGGGCVSPSSVSGPSLEAGDCCPVESDPDADIVDPVESDPAESDAGESTGSDPVSAASFDVEAPLSAAVSSVPEGVDVEVDEVVVDGVVEVAGCVEFAGGDVGLTALGAVVGSLGVAASLDGAVPPLLEQPALNAKRMPRQVELR